MKRSEIIKKIQSLYELELVLYPKESPSDIFAENLLCHLEELGMKPPAIYKRVITKRDAIDSRHSAFNYSQWVNQWEPEDETK